MTRTPSLWPEVLCFGLFLLLLDPMLAWSLGRYHHPISAWLLWVPLCSSMFAAGVVALVLWLILRNP